MEVPPHSPRDTNSLHEDPSRQQPQTTNITGQTNLNNSLNPANLGQRSTASGGPDYTNTSGGHKYTLSTCPTTASGPSTSQTWVSGPATVQINNSLLQDGASLANTSLQGGSTRLMPIDHQQQQVQGQLQGQAQSSTFTSSQTQQAISSSQWESMRTAQSSHVSHWTSETGAAQETSKIQTIPENSSITNFSHVEPQVSSSQWTSEPINLPNSQNTSNQPQAVSSTQWTTTTNTDPTTTTTTTTTNTQTYQASGQTNTTGLTAFNRENQNANISGVPTIAKLEGKSNMPMDYYDRAFDQQFNSQTQFQRQLSSKNPMETTTTTTTTTTNSNVQNAQQSSGIVNVSQSGTVADPLANQQNRTRRVVTGEPRETVRTIRTQLDYENQKVSENVVRREYGEMRVIATQERREDSRMYVKSERFVTHEVKVPRRVTREEITERTVVEQEKKMVEEIVQEACTVKERIVEWARPKIIEKVIEQPETVYQETIINVVETIQKPVVKSVVKEVPQERIIEVPVVVQNPVPYDVPDIQERVVPKEVIKYVDEIVTEERVIEKPVPQYVDVPTPTYTEKETTVDVTRDIPVCVEAEQICEVKIPTIKPRYKKIAYPVYLPKFIEVPMALDLMTQSLQGESTEFVSKINGFTKTAASLCDIENLASNIMRMDHGTTAANLMSADNLQAAVMKAWNSGAMSADGILGQGQYTSGGTIGGGIVGGGTITGGMTGGITTTSTGGMIGGVSGAANSSSVGLTAAAQYMSSTYASSRNYKSDMTQPVVAVS